MTPHPLIQDCINATGLNEGQVVGALGLVLTKLEGLLQADDFATLRKVLPELDSWKRQAPQIKKGFFGSLAGSLAGDQAGLLLELSRGLSALGISNTKHRPLAQALTVSVEKHYPELKSVFEKLKG